MILSYAFFSSGARRSDPFASLTDVRGRTEEGPPAAVGDLFLAETERHHSIESAGSCRDRESGEIAVGPVANAIGGTLGQSPTPCQAVLDVDRELLVPVAHRAARHVLGDAAREVTRELVIDVRVEVAPVTKVLQWRHGPGNPAMPWIVPRE